MTFRRILVAIDGSPHSLAALEAASENGRGVDVRYRTIASLDVKLLIDIAKLEGANVLILPRTSLLIENQDFENLIGGIRRPVFVVGYADG